MSLLRPSLLLFLAVLLLPKAGAFAQAPAGAPAAEKPQATVQGTTKVYRDIPYVTGGHPRQRLDLYLPAQSTGVRPLVAWIHGGGWTNGSKSGVQSKLLLAAGYAVASIEYRFSQDAIYPAQIEDCKAALRWLRAHAAEYELDPARFGVWGGSAGGHLVALLGTTGNIKDFDKGENLEQSSAVQCVIDWFGPTDFLHWGQAAPVPRGEQLVARLLGGPVQDKSDLARQASPVTFITKETAPFLLLHGDADPLVPLQQSELMDEALRKAGVPSRLITIPGGKHGGPEFTSTSNIMEMMGFLDKYLHPLTK